METFECPKITALHGVSKPSGFGSWLAWDKLGWLVRTGLSGDLLEAMEALREAGEWPTEEELGMCGGRGLSPERPADEARKRAGTPPSSVPPRSIGQAAASGRDNRRRDRLRDHY